MALQQRAPALQPTVPFAIELLSAAGIEARFERFDRVWDLGELAEKDRVIEFGGQHQPQQLLGELRGWGAQAQLAGPHRIDGIGHRLAKAIAHGIELGFCSGVVRQQRPQGLPEHLVVGFCR